MKDEKAPSWAWGLLIVISFMIMFLPSLLRKSPPSLPPMERVVQSTEEIRLTKPKPPMWPWGTCQNLSLNKGDTVETKLWVGPEMNFKATASKDFLVVARRPEEGGAYRKGLSGIHYWRYKRGSPEEPIRLVGLHNNTIVEFERVD